MERIFRPITVQHGETTKRVYINVTLIEYIEETDFPKNKIKKESRHNIKSHLRSLIDVEDWDEVENERQQDSIHSRKR